MKYFGYLLFVWEIIDTFANEKGNIISYGKSNFYY